MTKFHYLDPGKRLPEATASSAPRIELPLPDGDDSVAEPVLQLLELARQVGVDQRGDAVRLRGVDRPVKEQVGFWRTSSPDRGAHRCVGHGRRPTAVAGRRPACLW